LKERKMNTDPELCVRAAGGLKNGWSPEQIAGSYATSHPGGVTGMSVSHEKIYTWIYAQQKGELVRAGIVPLPAMRSVNSARPEEDRSSSL
jgi:IS30 family transposase